MPKHKVQPPLLDVSTLITTTGILFYFFVIGFCNPRKTNFEFCMHRSFLENEIFVLMRFIIAVTTTKVSLIVFVAQLICLDSS